jgi:8-oxo-dGTP pyrophosphatase MutT (NUDIX family)
LFCIRSTSLREHAGQVCFPGGKREPTDPSDEFTAIREAQEEISAIPEQVRIIGRLDQIISRSGRLVTPFVGVMPDNWYPSLSDEVEETFEVTIEQIFEDLTEYGYLQRNHLFSGKRFLWGLSFEIIVRMSEVGLDLKVDPSRYHIIWERIKDDPASRIALTWPEMAQLWTDEDCVKAPIRIFKSTLPSGHRFGKL